MVNKKNDEKDIEKLLGEKMAELADNVDCFDKIADRAFPKTGLNDTEDWFTVTGLENVTVRSKKTKRLKWAAVAAAAAVAVMAVPKTEIVPKLLSQLGSGSKSSFDSMISDICDTTSSGDFITFDVPLNYYIDNDVLITPLLSCPFEANIKEDALVRLYIRTVDNYPTNEVYALEYTGTFTSSSVIAAAFTDVRFTKEDVDKIQLSDRIVPDIRSKDISQAVENIFYDTDKGNLALHGKQTVSLASFTLIQHIKTDDALYPLAATDVIYYHNDARYCDEHYYDSFTYSATVNGNTEITDLPEREFAWKKSVYRNGRSAFPEKNASSFTKTEIFGAEPDEDIEQKGWAAVYPIHDDTVLPEIYGNKLSLDYCRPYRMGTFSTVLSPAQYCTAGFRMYFSPYKDLTLYSDFTPCVKIYCDDSMIYSAAVSVRYSSEEMEAAEFSDAYITYFNEVSAKSLEDTLRFMGNIQGEIASKKEEINRLRKKEDKTEEDLLLIDQYEEEVRWLEQSNADMEVQMNIIENNMNGIYDGNRVFYTPGRDGGVIQ